MSSPRAVSMITGTWLVARMRRSASMPSVPGIMTSSTTRSAPGASASSAPRAPSAAVSVSKPSRARYSASISRSSSSSSTSRIFGMGRLSPRGPHHGATGSRIALDRVVWRRPQERRLAMLRPFSRTAAALAAGAFATQLAAAEPKLPETMAWSAYDVGSGGYSQVVGIASAFKTRYGVNLRIIPGKNDVSRILPLKTGQLDFVANGSATYMQQEGVFEFGAPDWGPMPVRILLTNIGNFALPLIVAADTGVK